LLRRPFPGAVGGARSQSSDDLHRCRGRDGHASVTAEEQEHPGSAVQSCTTAVTAVAAALALQHLGLHAERPPPPRPPVVAEGCQNRKQQQHRHCNKAQRQEARVLEGLAPTARVQCEWTRDSHQLGHGDGRVRGVA
jgi:hypothetical protein